tara:strand:- start:460 stop:1080 length:621 start_codon:yes stop_codon:yes gene_type:complete
MKKFIDLFAGLGGASEAFLRTDWEVTRFDNNPLLEEVEEMQILDLMQIESQMFDDFVDIFMDGCVDVVWASPPCTDFSLAYGAPRPTALRNGEDFFPTRALEMVKKAKEIIDVIKPKYWIIENVGGSTHYISNLLGMRPRQIIGPFYLWGNFPAVNVDRNFKHSKFTNDKHSSDPLRANHRALIPYEISQAFRIAIENQVTLDKWM